MATSKRPIARGGKQEQKKRICDRCGEVQTHITVITNGKSKSGWQCKCGIVNKSGAFLVKYGDE